MTLKTKGLATPSFMSGADDKLATADVYEIKSDDLINNLPGAGLISSSGLLGENSKIADELRGGLAMQLKLPVNKDSLLSGASSLLGGAKSLTSGALSKITSAASAAAPSILQRLGSGTLNGIPGLSSVNLTSLTSVLTNNKLPSGISNALSAPIATQLGSFVNNGGTLSRVLPSQITSSYQVSSLINSVVNGNNPLSVVDKDSTVRLMSTLAGAAMSSGVPNAFGSVVGLAGGDNAIIRSAANAALSMATKSGNIAALKNIVTTAGVQAAVPLAKQLLTNVTQSYKIQPRTEHAVQDIKQDFVDLTGTMSSINNEWLSTTRLVIDPQDATKKIAENIIDLSTTHNCTPDAKTLLITGAIAAPDASDMKYLAMTGMFDSTSPAQELKRSFPMTYTSVAQTQNTPLTQLTTEQASVFDDFHV